jgi:hypothetical protein
MIFSIPWTTHILVHELALLQHMSKKISNYRSMFHSQGNFTEPPEYASDIAHYDDYISACI